MQLPETYIHSYPTRWNNEITRKFFVVAVAAAIAFYVQCCWLSGNAIIICWSEWKFSSIRYVVRGALTHFAGRVHLGSLFRVLHVARQWITSLAFHLIPAWLLQKYGFMDRQIFGVFSVTPLLFHMPREAHYPIPTPMLSVNEFWDEMPIRDTA